MSNAERRRLPVAGVLRCSWRVSPTGTSGVTAVTSGRLRRQRGMIDISFGRQVCGSLEAAAELEWLVADGLGGFAMGTVAGLRTRRYHGLLAVAPAHVG